MSKTKSPSRFSVGDAVRVKPGVIDPDFPDIPFGGWAGTILEIGDRDPRTCLIQLNERTLKSVHPIYRKRCERDGLFCQARRDRKRIELPMIEIEVHKGNPNRRLVRDYSYWFVNWQ